MFRFKTCIDFHFLFLFFFFFLHIYSYFICFSSLSIFILPRFIDCYYHHTLMCVKERKAERKKRRKLYFLNCFYSSRCFRVCMEYNFHYNHTFLKSAPSRMHVCMRLIENDISITKMCICVGVYILYNVRTLSL